MKVVILYPKLEPHKDYHYMPISALCVASSLESKGYDVSIVDERIECCVIMALLKELEDTNELYISVYSGYQLHRAYHIAKAIKELKPSVFITWGGPHVDANILSMLSSNLVDLISTGYAERGEHPINWNLIDIDRYVNPNTNRFIYISTYGCVGMCTFCATKTKRKWIEIPFIKVEKDIDNLMLLHSFKECVFFDATIFTKAERAVSIAELMIKHKLNWIADARADEICIMSKENLDYIMNSGVKRLTIGLESGSDKVVQQMKKGIHHLKRYKECAQIMSAYNVDMCSGVIFGCPGESVTELKETIAYIKEIKAINPNFYISTTFFMPLPDTIMADEAKKYGYIEPKTLEEWANLGSDGHYKYNEWMNNPWILDRDEYKRIYDEFISECDYLI